MAMKGGVYSASEHNLERTDLDHKDQEWTNFTNTSSVVDDSYSWTSFSVVSSSNACLDRTPVLQQIFPVKTVSKSQSHQLESKGWLEVNKRLWLSLCQHAACVGDNVPPLTSKLPETALPKLDLPADCDGFDWSSERTLEIVPTTFRPAKPESPIDIQFDHSRAALGLSSLTIEELRCMTEEMRSKFTHMSRTLVEGLQLRDQLAHELETKNKFVSTILRVQSLRVTSSDEGGRKRVWSIKQHEDKQTRKYLQSVVPYQLPDGMQWNTHMLTVLIEILVAIAEDDDKVPLLVADYIQTHILEPATDRREEHRHF